LKKRIGSPLKKDRILLKKRIGSPEKEWIPGRRKG
jgi:hypothetical protein